MTARRTWLICSGIAVAGVLALLVAGSRGESYRTYAAGAPNQGTIAALHPGDQVCEGPAVSQGAARSVGIWGASAGGTATLAVSVQDAGSHQVLASGQVVARQAETEWTANLNRDVPGGRPVRVCLTDQANVFSLAGSASSGPNLAMTGGPAGDFFALVLGSSARPSVLGALPTLFSRASLWRPSWVGSWTFWLLAVGVLAAFSLAVVAVVSAAGAPDEPAESGGGGHDAPGGEPELGPPDGSRSEPGQDRPQPVA